MTESQRAGSRGEGRRDGGVRFVANLAVSVDGKIDSAAREGAGFASGEDRERLFALRAETDAVVVGAETVRSEDPSFAPRESRIAERRRAAGRPEGLRIVVASRTGRISPEGRWLHEPAEARILAIPRDVVPRRIEPLEPLVANGELELCRGGEGGVDLPALERRLAELGCERVVVEGGGELVAAFLDAGLLEELRITLVPVAIGGRSSPTAVGGEGWPLARAPRLTLAASERVGDELFLRYRVGR